MNARWTLTAVLALEERRLRLTFADGEIHEVDLGPVLAAGGVFAPILEDRGTFEAARIDELGVLTWPGEVDLDPIVLRGDEEPVSGVAIPRRVVAPAR